MRLHDLRRDGPQIRLQALEAALHGQDHGFRVRRVGDAGAVEDGLRRLVAVLVLHHAQVQRVGEEGRGEGQRRNVQVVAVRVRRRHRLVGAGVGGVHDARQFCTLA